MHSINRFPHLLLPSYTLFIIWAFSIHTYIYICMHLIWAHILSILFMPCDYGIFLWSSSARWMPSLVYPVVWISRVCAMFSTLIFLPRLASTFTEVAGVCVCVCVFVCLFVCFCIYIYICVCECDYICNSIDKMKLNVSIAPCIPIYVALPVATMLE